MSATAIPKEGQQVWLSCSFTPGMFSVERSVKIDVVTNTSESKTIAIFVPTEDLKPTGDDSGKVRAIVARRLNGSTALLFRGEVFSATNPVLVSTEWLGKHAVK